MYFAWALVELVVLPAAGMIGGADGVFVRIMTGAAGAEVAVRLDPAAVLAGADRRRAGRSGDAWGLLRQSRREGDER